MSTSGQSSSGSTITEFACWGSSEVSSLSNFFRNSGRSRYFRSILIWNIVFLLLKSTMQSTFVTAETTLQDSFHEITSLFIFSGRRMSTLSPGSSVLNFDFDLQKIYKSVQAEIIIFSLSLSTPSYMSRRLLSHQIGSSLGANLLKSPLSLWDLNHITFEKVTVQLTQWHFRNCI